MPDLKSVTDLKGVTKERAWKGVSLAAAGIGGVIALRALEKAWEKSSGREAPADPEAHDIGWSEAIVWMALSGVTIGVARRLARLGAGQAWRWATDEEPPVAT